MRTGSKYQGLQDYLRNCDRPEVTLSFAEIERIIGGTLPSSAHRNRAWWSNRTKGALQANAWMTAGYLAEDVNITDATVCFRKPPSTYKVEIEDGVVRWHSDLIRGLRRHMGLSQAEFAEQIGVRQQTVSEWETNMYSPTRATSKHLSLIAEQAAFRYGESEAGG